MKRLRISSIEASQITDEVVDVVRNSDTIVNHFHIPLQAGSDTVLKRMRRKYTTAYYKERVQRLQDIFPDLAITTDVIVGFPGETEEEFRETYNFVRDLQFSEIHVFPYSKRTGTPAARREDQVDDDVKKQRVQQLISLSDQLAKDYASKHEGEVLEMIPEEADKEDPDNGMYIGYTSNYLKVKVPAAADMVGKIIRVKMTKAGYPYNEAEFIRVLDDAEKPQYVQA